MQNDKKDQVVNTLQQAPTSRPNTVRLVQEFVREGAEARRLAKAVSTPMRLMTDADKRMTSR